MASSNPGIQIRNTPVGKGVFAKRAYRKNQVVGQMNGTIIADDNYDPDYVVDLGKVGVLEPAAPFRFLNHSCHPNAALIEYDPEPGQPPTMWVEVLRAIKPGDQITIDYGWPADSAIRCLCGAKQCRGWVVAESELPKVLRRLAKEAKQQAAKPNPRKKSNKKAASRPRNVAAASESATGPKSSTRRKPLANNAQRETRRRRQAPRTS